MYGIACTGQLAHNVVFHLGHNMTNLHPIALTYILAPFGLVFGSFANVLIHRLPQERAEDRNVVTVPSHCPGCGKNIRWFHNIPVVSWLWLRGKCAACGWGIPFRYPLVELLAAALFGAAHWVFPFGTLIWIKGLICGYALIVLFFTDLTEYILPDVLQFPLMALGLLFTLPQVFWPDTAINLVMGENGAVQTYVAPMFHNGLQDAPARWVMWGGCVTWKASLIGLLAGYGFPWAFNFAYVKIRNAVAVGMFHKEPLETGMGMGDFKMLAWLGAFWGWASMLGILFVGVTIMCVSVLPTHFLRRRSGRTLYPLGCGLALATPIVVFWGPRLWRIYQNTVGNGL